MENVSKVDIQLYAKRNTSPKMPIEAKYVEAYVDSILNSTSIQKIYNEVEEKIQSKDQFLIFNSYWPDASNLNSEPYRSILAYAMLKKNFFLFQLIAYNLFTGTVKEFFGEDLFTSIVENTDEHPVHFTDEGTFTDMNGGKIIVGFQNYYSPSVLEDGSGSQYQSEEEYDKALVMFTSLITMVKPARINIVVFHVPYCFLTGNENYLESINIYTKEDGDEFFTSPFENPEAITALKNLSFSDLYNTYRTVEYGDSSIPGEQPQEISYEREVKESQDKTSATFSYEIRINYVPDQAKRGESSEEEQSVTEDNADKDKIWNKHIVIYPGDSSKKRYVAAKEYQPDKEYSEGYRPLLLRMTDDPNDNRVVSFLIYEDPTIPKDVKIATLLYTRYKNEENS